MDSLQYLYNYIENNHFVDWLLSISLFDKGNLGFPHILITAKRNHGYCYVYILNNIVYIVDENDAIHADICLRETGCYDKVIEGIQAWYTNQMVTFQNDKTT